VQICIVHFNLIEKYPPVINFIRYLAEHAAKDQVRVTVITTEAEDATQQLEVPGIEIRRVAKWKNDRIRLRRLGFYMSFAQRALAVLRSIKPSVVLYYETISAAAPLFYKQYVNKDAKIFVHYHEYMSPQEYNYGIFVVKWLHRLERKMYPQIHSVSHTNHERMKKFLSDVGNVKGENTGIVPNYPPAGWQKRSRLVRRSADPRTGFVYVGALSFETMYAREMIDFVAAHPAECYWHIYSNNFDTEVTKYIEQKNPGNIEFKGGVSYDQLPSILGQYDVGLILYKGTISNFVFNAPNKFFEYFCCGLNVWFSQNMLGMHPYLRSGKPWVKMVDFANLSLAGDQEMKRIESVPECIYNSETVYADFYDRIRRAVVDN
jgi:hypothetical protein